MTTRQRNEVLNVLKNCTNLLSTKEINSIIRLLRLNSKLDDLGVCGECVLTSVLEQAEDMCHSEEEMKKLTAMLDEIEAMSNKLLNL